jgi:hypothetical protein
MSYTDWTSIVNDIPNAKDKVILELGCGVGTKTLLDNFKFVYSWETYPTNEWWDYSNEQYSKYANWKGYFKDFDHWGFTETELLLKGSGKPEYGKVRDLTALDKYWESLLSTIDISKIDVAFVDQGFHLRGETVNRFMELGVPYIFWHDSNNTTPKDKPYTLYGWDLINISTPYRVIKTLGGKGTTLISKV